MIRRPQYKVARLVGDRIYPKTQTPKFAARLAARTEKRGRGKSEFGTQLLEKQKVRYTYGVTEKQFSNTVKEAVRRGGTQAPALLFRMLETRLDNTVFRLGVAPSRTAARQMVSHGHITVNGRRVTIPSYHVRKGDVLSVRAGSRASALFQNLEEKRKGVTVPEWLRFDEATLEGTVLGEPGATFTDMSLNLPAVLEFYSRA